ncbi:MAG TPA: adenosylcobinamide-GDP ribazoletransferase [Flavobacterium sp.]|nr:adenosylcobinamide-GDP ribazoletransferase [Flavobacterium sp.]
MKNEIRIFFTALMFYTRIPCPANVGHSEEYINKSTRYFPLIGWIVGGCAALAIYLLHFIFPDAVCIILSLAASVLLTGAFHEDGFADVCDGFGGGWTKEKIMEIMKDSRIGAYGAIGLILLFALKIAVLIGLMQLDLWFCLKSVMLAHVLSRFAAVTAIFTHPYSREDASSKIKPIAKQLSAKELAVSSIWVFPALLLFLNLWIVLALLPAYAVKMYMSHYFARWIGGYTGDCLGAIQQASELAILLFCLGIWKFI